MSEPNSSSATVVVEGLSKSFDRPEHQVSTLKEQVLQPFRPRRSRHLRALRDVSLSVGRGEFLGIVGRNGSGKSTLLKCLAGIYRADEGKIWINGSVSTFIELGVGFNPELAALDNVMINAAMLGLSRREAKQRFDAVIDFAELEDFTDLKIKNYSSGMRVRLAFSVMIQLDADVLLIDEVLAVGDAAFQQKCFDEFEQTKQKNKTVLLVTHNMGAVDRFCDRAVLLERGRIAAIGEPEAVAQRYVDLNFSPAARTAAAKAESAVNLAPDADDILSGDGRVGIEEAWFEDSDGKRLTTLTSGADVAFSARIRFVEAVRNPIFSVTLSSSARIPLFSASSEWSKQPSGQFAAGEELVWKVEFKNALGPDRYGVTPAVTLRDGATLAARERISSVVVTRTNPGPLVDIPFTEQIVRSTPTDANQS